MDGRGRSAFALTKRILVLALNEAVFRPSATVSQIGLMESRVHHHRRCRG